MSKPKSLLSKDELELLQDAIQFATCPDPGERSIMFLSLGEDADKLLALYKKIAEAKV